MLHFLTGVHKWSFPRREELSEDIAAIVVLSGGMHRPTLASEVPVLAEDSYYRCLHAAQLYHEHPARIVVLSGGHVARDSSGPSLAEAMKQFMLRQGVLEDHLLLEDRSTTTYENALFSAELIKAQGIDEVILVTDAYHLPRAELCFRSHGVDVVPSASRYHTGDYRWTVWNCLPRAGASRDVQRALHEWLGILWYRMRGYV